MNKNSKYKYLQAKMKPLPPEMPRWVPFLLGFALMFIMGRFWIEPNPVNITNTYQILLYAFIGLLLGLAIKTYSRYALFIAVGLILIEILALLFY